MKKVLALMLALVVMVSALAGCTGGKTAVDTGEFTDVSYKFNEEADNFSDISEMPDWTGEKLDLQLWFGTGSYSNKKTNLAVNDVVWPELQRVTGIRFTEDSFDNNGETQDAKIAKVIATGEWPAIIMGNQENVTEMMIEKDMIWDLTELIPKYMPHVAELMEKGDYLKSPREDGKIYELDICPKVTYAYPEIPQEVIARKEMPASDTSYVYIRDDILKKLKPEAYTQKELLDIFEKNGKFTDEEILNASFSSKEEFYQFLRDVKALNLKEGNRDVYGTYAFAGSDNWDFTKVLAGGLNGFDVFKGTGPNPYFSYYDVETEKIQYMFKEEFFKDIMKELTELVQEDVIAQDSLIDNRATFEEKCANGQYAVLYGGTMPNLVTLNKNAEAKGYQYRKVILNIPYDTEKYLPMANTIGNDYSYVFVKSEISAEQLPQVLRFFDFLISEVGQKVVMWGPKSAGLFEDTADGGRKFTNKELEEAFIYGGDTQVIQDYGLKCTTWPPVPQGVNKWDPIYVYDFTPSSATLDNFYSTGINHPQERIHGIIPAVYNFTNEVEETQTFWGARTAYEEALTKILTAKNDEEFEQLYNEMIATAERNGLTDEALEKINDAWVNKVNKDYMQNVYDHIKKVK